MADDYLDVTGDDIWYGSHLVGRITLPVGTFRDQVVDQLQASSPIEDLEAEHAKAIEDLESEHADALEVKDEQITDLRDKAEALQQEVDDLTEWLDRLKETGAGAELVRLREELQFSDASAGKWRVRCFEMEAQANGNTPATRRRKRKGTGA